VPGVSGRQSVTSAGAARRSRRARVGVRIASNHPAVLIAHWYAHWYSKLEGGLLVVARSFEFQGDVACRCL